MRIIRKYFNIVALAVLLLGLVPNAHAANNISIDKPFHLVSDPMTIVVTGLTDNQLNNLDAKVGIFLKGDSANSDPLSGMYAYVRYLRDNQTWNIKAPTAFGSYEVRVFWNLSDGSKFVLDTIPFTVGSVASASGNIGISGSFFLVKDKITVTIKGLTQGQIDDSAWAGLFLPTDIISSSSYNSTSTYISSLRDDMTWTFDAPTTFGNYEIRVFTKKTSPLQQDAFFGKVSFSVGSNPGKPTDVTINKSAVKAGEDLVATFTGLTQGQIDDDAYAGVFLSSDALDASPYGSYTYVSYLRDDSHWSFNAPTTPGLYEVRVFTKHAPALRAQSYFGTASFKVLPAATVGGLGTTYRISVSPSKGVEVKRHKSLQFKVKATPKSGGAAIDAAPLATYSVSNPKIASVSSTGVITGIKKGSVKVTISFGGASKVIRVKVK